MVLSAESDSVALLKSVRSFISALYWLGGWGNYICFPLFAMCEGMKNVERLACHWAASCMPLPCLDWLRFCVSPQRHRSTCFASLAPRWQGQLDESGQGSLQPCNNETQPARIASGKSVTVTATGVIEKSLHTMATYVKTTLFYQ